MKKIITEELIADIARVEKTTEDRSMKYYVAHGKYTQSAIDTHGGWKRLLVAAGFELPPVHNKLSKEVVEKDLMRVFDETGDTRCENYLCHGKYSKIVIKRLYGGWNKMLAELGYNINMHKAGQYSAEDIIERYKELQKQLDIPITAKIFRKHSGYSQKAVDNMFGSFSNLQKELGEKIDGRFVSDEEIKEDLVRLHKQYGLLSTTLFDEEGIVSNVTLMSRFGNLQSVCDELKIPCVKPTGESKLFRQCMNNIEKILGNNYVKEKTFPWLKNPHTGGSLRLDAFYPDLNLAIEIDVAQHRSEYHAFPGESLAKTQYRDRIKDKLCFQHGITVVRIIRPSIKHIKEKLGLVK